MNTDAVLRDLGPILAHGEPETGIGQGESTEPPPTPPSRPPTDARAATDAAAEPRQRQRRTANWSPSTSAASAPPAPTPPERRRRPPSRQGDHHDHPRRSAGRAGRRARQRAALAARIPVPRRLPARYDGQPLRHLSHSSYTRFLLCPEDWRRHYLHGERIAPSGAMFLGSRVDDALTIYYRHLLERGEALTLDQLTDAYRDHWSSSSNPKSRTRGIHWDAELDEQAAFDIGLDALELTFAELIPQLGRPVAVQRKLEYALAPGLEWTVQCYLDLETLRDDGDGEPVPAIVDYKVKSTPHSQPRPTTTRRPASTSPAAGSPATRRATSASPRSPSPASGASR